MFKIGDRVKYTSGDYGDSPTDPVWDGKCGKITGTIMGFESDDEPILVEWDSNESGIKTRNNYEDTDLEYVVEITMSDSLFDL